MLSPFSYNMSMSFLFIVFANKDIQIHFQTTNGVSRFFECLYICDSPLYFIKHLLWGSWEAAISDFDAPCWSCYLMSALGSTTLHIGVMMREQSFQDFNREMCCWAVRVAACHAWSSIQHWLKRIDPTSSPKPEMHHALFDVLEAQWCDKAVVP